MLLRENNFDLLLLPPQPLPIATPPATSAREASFGSAALQGFAAISSAGLQVDALALRSAGLGRSRRRQSNGAGRGGRNRSGGRLGKSGGSRIYVPRKKMRTV